MITFQVEKFHHCIGDAAPLTEAHHREFGSVPLRIDRTGYARLEERGQLLIVTAREHGWLIAYATALLMPYGDLHSKTPYAETGVFYISPKWRHGVVILALFRRMMRELKARNITEFYPLAHGDAAARLFALLGFHPAATLHRKSL